MKKTRWIILMVSFLLGASTLLLAGERNTGRRPSRRGQAENQGKSPKLLPSPTESVPLPHINIQNKKPLWSPDGKRIAFLSNRQGPDVPRGERQGIYVINADGTNLRRLLTSALYRDEENSFVPYKIRDFCWSPDGTKIAFETGSWSDIYVIDVNSKTLRNLTNKPGNYSDLCWSPDGSKVAFTKHSRRKETEIWIIEANGEFWYKLIKGLRPAWSPDSKQIAFVSGQRTPYRGFPFFIVRVDGKNQQNLNLYQVSPNSVKNIYWSIDGTNIFIETKPGSYIIVNKGDIYRGIVEISLKTGRVQSVASSLNSSPSPDGKELIFEKDKDIYKTNLRSKRNLNLTKTKETQEGEPCWSSNGKRIVYIRDNEIWVMNSNGSKQTQLTFERTEAIKEAKRKQAKEKAAREISFRKILQEKEK